MLNVTPIRGNNQHAAAHYFSSSDDYYAKEEAGQWQGKGAETLGLSGSIDQAQFARLLNGQLPDGQSINATFDRETNMKRMGLDLTFSAPKSVSMQALAGGDRAVTDAHDKAVAIALEQVEKLAQTRKKEKGKSYRERTGNMVIGKFRHEMSRAKDPQLHTHAVVLNMTQRNDGKWRALANEDIFRVQHEVDAVYKAELARELRGLGYAIRLTDDKGSFELDHISRDQIEAFSERSKVIEDALADKGKTRATSSAYERDVISLATRQRKEKGDVEIIKKYWLEKSRESGIDYQSREGISVKSYQHEAASASSKVMSVQGIIEYAVRHMTERESVIKESALIATATQRSVGLAGYTEIKAEIKKLADQGTLILSEPAYKIAEDKTGMVRTAPQWQTHLQESKGMSAQAAKLYVRTAITKGSLVETERSYTTQAALEREKAILAIEKDGRAGVTPIMEAVLIKTALADKKLTAGQQSVVETILGTQNRFVGVQGDAGTGKTYAVNQVRELLDEVNSLIKSEDKPYCLLTLAPYGNQVKALKNEGMEAHTLASFLYTKNKPIDDKTIIVLDEAAVVGTRQLVQLMRVVEKANARLVMIGDTKQTEAIEAGKPFAQLQKNGMQTARLHEVQRQKTPELKVAVEKIAAGHAKDSLSHIAHIEEITDNTARHLAIATDYSALAVADRKESLVITGTNVARKEINTLIRSNLELAGEGKHFATLTRLDLTQAQRRYAPSYKQHMVIQPEKDYPKAGLVRGESYTVIEALPGNLLALQKPDKTTVVINPRQINNISVYTLERIELSVGDIVRMNRNDTKLDITNGDRMKVVELRNDQVTLEPIGQKVNTPLPSLALSAAKPLHLEYGYCSTVHSSQGLTSDRVYISLDTKSRTTSKNLYYVAISRARHEARIYTNSAKELPSAIARQYTKTSALELQKERKDYSAKHSAGKKKIGIEGKSNLAPGKELNNVRKQDYQYAAE